MKIAVDTWTLASRFRCQGTYVYTQNLLREFKKLAGIGSGVSFSVFASDRNGNDAAKLDTGESFELRSARFLDYDRAWRLGGCGYSAARSRADVLFIPTAATLPVGPIPSVCTIHDVTPLTMPSHSPRVTASQRIFLKGCAKYSNAIITSSECSKKDIVALLGVPPEKVTVIHDGCDQALFNTESVDTSALAAFHARLGIGKPYILHHGTIQPRKNLKRLIEAFRMMLERNRDLDLDLVLAGQLGWASDEVTKAAQLSGRGKVIFSGMLADADLALLIKDATMAVVPSLYEGFSLPIVEAMACGVPTIAAKTSCLPEISGNVLAYFDPLSVEEMAACMQSVLLDLQLNQRLRINGIDRARQFTWEQCAQETLNVLLRVGNGN